MNKTFDELLRQFEDNKKELKVKDIEIESAKSLKEKKVMMDESTIIENRGHGKSKKIKIKKRRKIVKTSSNNSDINTSMDKEIPFNDKISNDIFKKNIEEQEDEVRNFKNDENSILNKKDFDTLNRKNKKKMVKIIESGDFWEIQGIEYLNEYRYIHIRQLKYMDIELPLFNKSGESGFEKGFWWRKISDNIIKLCNGNTIRVKYD